MINDESSMVARAFVTMHPDSALTPVKVSSPCLHGPTLSWSTLSWSSLLADYGPVMLFAGTSRGFLHGLRQVGMCAGLGGPSWLAGPHVKTDA